VSLALASTASTNAPPTMPALRVVTVPILEDNYAYLLVCEASKTAACVDPAEASTVIAAAQREGVKLTHVLTTHCHWDHAGGNNDMVSVPARVQHCVRAYVCARACLRAFGVCMRGCVETKFCVRVHIYIYLLINLSIYLYLFIYASIGIYIYINICIP